MLYPTPTSKSEKIGMDINTRTEQAVLTYFVSESSVCSLKLYETYLFLIKHFMDFLWNITCLQKIKINKY